MSQFPKREQIRERFETFENHLGPKTLRRFYSWTQTVIWRGEECATEYRSDDGGEWYDDKGERLVSTIEKEVQRCFKACQVWGFESE